MDSKFFNKIDTELKAYLLGFYVGDGSIYIRRDRKEYSVKFSQVVDNRYIIDLIIKTIGDRNIQIINAKEGNIKGKKFKSKAQYVITYYSKQMVIDLISLGYGIKKTYRNVGLPLYLDNSLILHFIRGYFDADGTCGTYLSTRADRPIGTRVKPTFHITAYSKRMLEDIQIFLQDYNISVPIYNSKGYWVLKSGSKKEIMKLYTLLYAKANYFLPHKEEKFKKVMLTSSEFRKLKLSGPCNA